MIKRNNSGFSFVLIVIVMVVVSFVVASGIAISMSNYNMKTTKVNSVNNFYDAESGLNAIRGCIEERCSDVFKDSYNIITNALTEIPTSELDKEFQNIYLNSLNTMFATVDIDSSLLTEYLRKGESIPVVYLDTTSNFVVNASGIELDITNSKFTIKEVSVTYTDNNYTDTITTDIVCTAPEPFGKAGTNTSLIDVYSQYALIADNYIDFENKGELIKGSIYSGKDIIVGNNKACDIILHSNNIISRGDLLVYPKSTLKVDSYNTLEPSDIYINNLVTTKERYNGSPMTYANNSYSALDLYSNLYLKGDLLLNSKYGNTKLKGQYYGYSTYKDNTTNASAFNINAPNIDVDMEELSTLWIAGNNYIDLPTIVDATFANDILMGESLTGKFTQSIYLVPSCCIYAEDEQGNRKMLSNPIDKTEYPNYQVDLSKNAENGGIDLTKYVSGTMQEDKFNGGYREVNIQFNAGDKLINRTYLYLVMKDTNSASMYLQEYNLVNDKYLTDRAESYKFGNISIADNCLLKTTGNVLSYDGNEVKIENFGLGNVDTYTEYQENFLNLKYKSLYSTLTDTELTENDSLFEYMINTEKIKNSTSKFSVSDTYFVANNVVQYNNATDNTMEVDTIEDEYGQKYIFLVVDGDVTIKKDFYGVVIATGDINIVSNQVNLHGTLISGNDINFGIAYCSIDNQGANIASLAYLLSQYEGHDVFREYFKYIDSDYSGSHNGTIDITDTITYKNWVRE